MADTALDLSDEQIDRLLAEAESRLAAQETAITLNKDKAVVSTSPATVAPTTDLPNERAKLSKDLSVRKPELRKDKKKVCCI